MYIILKPKLLHLTKDMAKVIVIIISGFLLILAMIFIKYKPVYEITVAGEKIGYIENLKEFKKEVEEQIINQEEEYIANISFIEEPIYKMKLLTRTSNQNEEEIIENLKLNNTIKTYKYYEISLNNEKKSCVDTLEEAEQIINEIKAEFSEDDLELNLQVNEKYTEDVGQINTDTIEVATTAVETAAQEIKEESQALAIINNVKISILPVTGRITSRYGESSSRRKSTHTGLDIACITGTNIQVVSEGTVIFATRQGSYGNLVKVDHGNGVETWYGHCSKIYAKVGDKVKAGDVIATVGSTGNSTGPHLHLEIRVNGNTVNPQNYVY